MKALKSTVILTLVAGVLIAGRSPLEAPLAETATPKPAVTPAVLTPSATAELPSPTATPAQADIPTATASQDGESATTATYRDEDAGFDLRAARRLTSR